MRIVPDKTGSFEFICDVFCGDGHEEMSGKIVVKEWRPPPLKKIFCAPCGYK